MKNYKIEKCDKHFMLKFGPNHEAQDSKLFEEDMGKEIVPAGLHVVVDCTGVEMFSKDWIRCLLKMQLDLKKKSLGVKLTCSGAHLQSFFKKEGLDKAFAFQVTVKDALVDLGLAAQPAAAAGGAKKGLDIEFVNPFLEATMHVLKVQASIEAKSGKLGTKKDETFSGDISGIIGVVSSSFNGSVVITFPEATFLKIMSSMLGEEYKQINQEILDGAAEITNMIFGAAKVVLNQKGYGIQIALPSVLHGKNHKLTTQTKGPTILVPFESTAGNFYVEISLSSAAAPGAAAA